MRYLSPANTIEWYLIGQFTHFHVVAYYINSVSCKELNANANEIFQKYFSKSFFAFGSWLGALKHGVALSEPLAAAVRSLPAAGRALPASLSASVVFQNAAMYEKRAEICRFDFLKIYLKYLYGCACVCMRVRVWRSAHVATVRDTATDTSAVATVRDTFLYI